jgi:hypothetical protein
MFTYPEYGGSGGSLTLGSTSDATGTWAVTYAAGISNPVNAPGVMKVVTGTTGYKYLAMYPVVTTAGTYALSYYSKLAPGSATSSSNLGNSNLLRDAGTGGLGDNISASGDMNPTHTTSWQRWRIVGGIGGDAFYWFPLHSGTLTGGYTIYLCGFQFEKLGYSTNFVVGSRSASQSLIDLTGNTVPDITACTYDASGNITFNASSSYIRMPNSTLLDSQTITMESWCKPTVTSQSGFLFEKGSVNSQYSMFFETGGNFFFRTTGTSTGDLTFTTATYITAGAWNHVVCTYGAGTKTCYVNGVQVAQQTGLTGTISTNSSGMSIGAYGGYSGAHSYFFNGSIGMTKVYNKALTAAEVMNNFNASRGRYGL